MEFGNNNQAGFPTPLEGINTNRSVLQDINNIIDHHMPMRKRTLQKKHAAVDPSNQSDLFGHRPVTRRFAASLASQSMDATKEPTGSVGKKRNADAAFRTTGYVEGSEQEEDLPMLPEIEKLVRLELTEVEMEDTEDATLDIESCDASNPLAVAEYVDDIYNFYRTSEDFSLVSPDYMLRQTDINKKMRRVLIQWLIEVHHHMEMMDETVHLTVNIVDRYLERQNVSRSQLQLVGVGAMLVACKYHEVTVPMVDDLVQICAGAYTRENVLQMEKMILSTVEFILSVPTPYCFLGRFLKAAAQADKKKNQEVEALSLLMIELSLMEYEMLRFRPSLLAAASVYAAQSSVNGFTSWTNGCEQHTMYTEEQLRECSEIIAKLHKMTV